MAASLALVVAVLFAFGRFAAEIERRPGLLLHDPILAALRPRDLTWAIFGVIHGSVVVALASLARTPRRLAAGLQAYAVIMVLRMATLAVVPLEAPPGAIPLQDPLVERLCTGQVLTRDLFFSGHTATMALLVLTAAGPRLRILFVAATAVVGACLVGQAVHYTVDVLAAPPFAWLGVRAAAALRRGATRPFRSIWPRSAAAGPTGGSGGSAPPRA